MPSKMWDESHYPFPIVNGATVNVMERMSNFIARFVMDVITYPCWDYSKSMLVKGAQANYK